MKSLERRFKDIESKNPNYSSYICFAEAIDKQRFSRRAIRHWFDKLVDKDDYAVDEKNEVLRHLCTLAKPTEDDQIGT